MAIRSIDAHAVKATGLARTLTTAALVALCLVTVAYMVWNPAMSGLPFDGLGHDDRERVAVFDPELLDAAAVAPLRAAAGSTPHAVVVHLRDPACPCTRAADEQFAALVRRSQGSGTVFAIADAPGSTGGAVNGLENIPRLDPDHARRLWHGLVAAPAVAVFEADGRPAFLGPYADVDRCRALVDGPIDPMTAAAQSEEQSSALPLVAVGCFCKHESRPFSAELQALGPGPDPTASYR